jgi:hypothetical protein
MQPDNGAQVPLNGSVGGLAPDLTSEQIENHTEVMVSRSLRLPSDVFDELTAIAAEQGIAWSTLIRQWVIDGIAAARTEAGQEVDPAIELQRGVELVTRAAARLRQRVGAP